MTTRFAALAMVLCLVSLMSLAQDQMSPVFEQEVSLPASVSALGQTAVADWTTGTLRVTGAGTAQAGLTQAQARLRARGAARADAQRLLALAVGEVRVTAETIVRDYVLQSDTVRTRVDVLLTGVTFPQDGESIQQLEDGSFIVHADAVLPIFGSGNSLASAVLPTHQQRAREEQDSLEGPPETAEPEGASPSEPKAPEEPARSTDTAPSAIGVTGLIVDASRFEIEPTMAPRVFDPQGNVVYGILDVSTEFANNVGVVGYHHTVASAMNDPRAGDNPLVVAAVDVLGKSIFDEHPVVGSEDAARIRLADQNSGFLSEANVLFVGQ